MTTTNNRLASVWFCQERGGLSHSENEEEIIIVFLLYSTTTATTVTKINNNNINNLSTYCWLDLKHV